MTIPTPERKTTIKLDTTYPSEITIYYPVTTDGPELHSKLTLYREDDRVLEFYLWWPEEDSDRGRRDGVASVVLNRPYRSTPVAELRAQSFGSKSYDETTSWMALLNLAREAFMVWHVEAMEWPSKQTAPVGEL